MAYYGRRRGPYISPREEERRERQRKTEARIARDRERLARLLRQYRQIPLSGEEAQFAWAQRQVRSYQIGQTSNEGDISTLLRTDGRHLYLQVLSFPGWRFYRLVPRYHTPRESEEPERDARRSRR
jgi:hypothetical protein